MRDLAATIWTLINLSINKTMGHQIFLCLLMWCNQYTGTSLKGYYTKSTEFQIVTEFKHKFIIPQGIKEQIIGHQVKATSKIQAIGYFMFSSKYNCDIQTTFGHLFKQTICKKVLGTTGEI